MDAHARWLIRIGACLIALHPFTAAALQLAERHGIPRPQICRPPFGDFIYYELNQPFEPLPHLLFLFILGLPVLGTFPRVREKSWLKGFQIADALLLSLLFLLRLTRSSDLGSGVPRWIHPVTSLVLILGAALLGYDRPSIARLARILIPACMLVELLLSGFQTPRWLVYFLGLPFGVLGSAMMLAGELLYPRPKPLAPPPPPS